MYKYLSNNCVNDKDIEKIKLFFKEENYDSDAWKDDVFDDINSNIKSYIHNKQIFNYIKSFINIHKCMIYCLYILPNILYFIFIYIYQIYST